MEKPCLPAGRQAIRTKKVLLQLPQIVWNCTLIFLFLRYGRNGFAAINAGLF